MYGNKYILQITATVVYCMDIPIQRELQYEFFIHRMHLRVVRSESLSRHLENA